MEVWLDTAWQMDHGGHSQRHFCQVFYDVLPTLVARGMVVPLKVYAFLRKFKVAPRIFIFVLGKIGFIAFLVRAIFIYSWEKIYVRQTMAWLKR